MDDFLLVERARVKIIKLRTYATREGETKGKYHELFSKMEKDDLCQQLFDYMNNIKKEEIRQRYNDYIRKSTLSKKEQQELII